MAPDPAPLPQSRTQDLPPFTVSGVDFAGALYVQQGRDEVKVYICLFTCATTRAIHLEVVTDLSTETFLLAFRRFTSRKGLPQIVISDNASTYLSAAEELTELFNSVDLANTLSKQGITWKFIPKRAPWYGGFWERLIGLTKSCLKKVLGRAHINLLTLQTLVVEIEAILNDRPLTYVSSDAQDPDPLTPADLLYGRHITSLPYRHVEEDELTDPTIGDEAQIQKRAKKQSLIIEHFRSRWKHEYLTSLRESHKTSGNNQQKVKTGDIVLIHDDKPRVDWRLAVIEELIPGGDGLIRAANLRTSTGKTNRPITKLYPLEVNTNVDSTVPEITNAESDDPTSSNKRCTTDSSTLPDSRPQRVAARREECEFQSGTKFYVPPPEDVEMN